MRNPAMAAAHALGDSVSGAIFEVGLCIGTHVSQARMRARTRTDANVRSCIRRPVARAH
jgi:hypothetical protein